MMDIADILSNGKVSIFHEPELDYPHQAPYSPSTRYPEYFIPDMAGEENKVYEAVRNSLALLNLDKDAFGTSEWDPLRAIIKPGDTVVIKPNFVLSSHEESGNLFSIITHPAVIRATVDYAYISLQGKGRIIIADAPQMDCNFSELLEKTKLESIKDLYKRELGFDIEIYDLRDFWLDKKRETEVAYVRNRYKLPGDPLGGVLVNLGRESLFYGVDNYKRFYGADYNREETIRHHHRSVQEYLVSQTILSADVVISVPKLKVHKKVGVTLNMKGLVGACVNKNYLVHYTLGTPSEGGDQFPDHVLGAKEMAVVKLQRWAFDKFLSQRTQIGDFLYDIVVKAGKLLLKPLGFRPLERDKSILDGGNWYGNDSTWRMAVDLTRIFIYADRQGKLQDTPVRRIFSLVDGVIGGERDGPLTPDSKRCGLIIAGFNPCAVDLICTRLMGFDYEKIKMLAYILNHPGLFKVSLSGIETSSNRDFGDLFDKENKNRYFDFAPHPGWQGHIEIR